MRRTSVLLCSAVFVVASRAQAYQWVETDCQTQLLIDGTTSMDAFGWLVLGIGDVDGDGTPDIVTSAPLSGAGAQAGGMVSAYSGSNGAVLWSRTESVTSAILGYSMDVLDWNGDGVLDVLAAAPFAQGGVVRVFSGQSGATLFTYSSGGVTDDSFGSSLALHGDYDGDGVPDVAIAATGVDLAAGTNAGRVYVFSGATHALITSIDAPLLVAGDAEFGIGLTFVGDISQPPDGRDDLVATYRHTSFFSGGAIAYAFDGVTSHVVWAVDGVPMDYNLLGNRCDGGGDVDGDGIHDFVVGATHGNIAQVRSGADGSVLFTLDGNAEGGSFGSGHMVPDVDGDGRADVLVGAASNSVGGPNAGKTFLYSGRTGLLIRTMTATTANKRLGREVRAIGDQDGDGIADFAIAGGGGGTSSPPPGRVTIVRGISPFQSFCSATPNSTGSAAHISASGTSSAGAHDLVLRADHVTHGAGLFVHGSGTTQVVFGNGFRCIAGNIRRGPVGFPTGASASATYDGHLPGLDLLPYIGTVRHFQYWYRDVAAGGAAFNLSDGVSVTIWP